MVMMETDEDKLLHNFLNKGEKEIADDGFSKKVMRKLYQIEHEQTEKVEQSRKQKILQYGIFNSWTKNASKRCWLIENFALALICILLLLKWGRIQTLIATFQVSATSFLQACATIDPRSIIAAVIVLLILAVKKISTFA